MAKVNNDFHKIMNERRSVRRFDSSVKIEREELVEMLDEAITAPSACNLQAWKFVVIDTEEGKEKLRSFCMKFNHTQINSSSAVVMFFGNTLAYEKYSALWHGMFEAGKVSEEAMNAALNTFLPLYQKADRKMLVEDAMVDTSLAAMQFMLVAREHGYETNAMAGYDVSKAASTFDLDPEQYVPVMAIAIGKPDETAEEITTTRYPISELVDFS